MGFIYFPLFGFAQKEYMEDYFESAISYYKQGNIDSAWLCLGYVVDHFPDSWELLKDTDLHPFYNTEKWKIIEQKAIKNFYEVYKCENQELALELLLMGQKDQQWRKKLDDYEMGSEEYDEVWENMKVQDIANLARIEAVFHEYGYPTKELVGSTAFPIPMLIIHHSNCEKIKIYYPLIKKAVKKKGGALFFMFYEDRYLGCKGKKQKYGTQSSYNGETGKAERLPVQKRTLRKNENFNL